MKSNHLFFVAAGTVFGFALSRSGAADYDFIQAMFLFENLQLYGIMGVSVAILAPTLWFLKRRAAARGEDLAVTPKPVHRGNIIGGAMFGVGWALTGMCPGPILVNVGEGKVYALAALAGTLIGAAIFGVLYPKLQKPLQLPPLDVGTGDG